MSGRGRPRKDRDDNPGSPKAKSPPTTRKKSTPTLNEQLEDKKTTAKAKKLQESQDVGSRDGVNSPEGPRKPKATKSGEKKTVGSERRANSIEEDPSKTQQRAPEKARTSQGPETAKARCPIKAQESQEAHPRTSPKSATCTEEPQTPKRAKSVEKKSAPVSSTRRGSSTDGNPSKTLQNALEKLTVKKSQRSEAAECVNAIQETITDYLKKNVIWCKDISPLKTGSYYENVKICEPDEFDVMLTIRVDRVKLEPFSDDGAFYSVEMKRQSPRHPLDKFVNEDKTIMASEMLNEFRQKIKEALGTLPYDVRLERKKIGCPAVTLVVNEKKKEISIDFVLGLEVHSSWPDFTKDGFKIENWLGKNERMEQRREPFYLVPKYEGRGNTEQDGVMAKDAWRISFSHVEKYILKKHGNRRTCCQGEQKCCRKQCLKLLKFLFQRLKEEHPEETEKLCSYHAKTTLFHACAKRVMDSEWAFSELSHCFQQLVMDFEQHLRVSQLPNFFIPSQNLLSCISKKHCNRLADYIESQRNNGFPLMT
ncbi:cyclic GMP-AMP synthase [Clarias gariepinus]|uniref:cyclic GMP-AMP synthase n=1 Tax=Clarias gariepinus TaxID=13013 RepID=UPI00234D9B1C|nr:cyclic GMP-AMP synthase [Clarias gariepinus]